MKLVASEGMLCIPARDATGFDVWVREDGWNEWTLGFSRWSEKQTDATALLATLALGLSDGCRLEVTSQAGRDFRWTLQQKHGSEWSAGSSFIDRAFHILPFKRKRFLQNNWMRNDDSIRNIDSN